MKTHTAIIVCLFSTLVGGCSSSTDESNRPANDGKQYINLATGQVEQFAGGEAVPPGYGECTEQGCPEPYPCAEIDANACSVRDDCEVGVVPGCNPNEQACDFAGCASRFPDACDPSECPAQINLVAMICDDGSAGISVCERAPDGTCEYVQRCDAPCTPEDCGVMPELAMSCEDGAPALPVCERTSAGVCSWGFLCNDEAVVSDKCELSECGAALAVVQLCANGLPAEMVCARDTSDACRWVFDCSSTQQCTPADCIDEPVMIHVCEDGTDAMVACLPTEQGLCEWSPVCPL